MLFSGSCGVPIANEQFWPLKKEGDKVVGLTKMSRCSSEEKVKAFLQQKKVTYPMAKETGQMSRLFAVTGIPAAALVKDGKVVWRGHPARMTAKKIKSY